MPQDWYELIATQPTRVARHARRLHNLAGGERTKFMIALDAVMLTGEHESPDHFELLCNGGLPRVSMELALDKTLYENFQPSTDIQVSHLHSWMNNIELTFVRGLHSCSVFCCLARLFLGYTRRYSRRYSCYSQGDPSDHSLSQVYAPPDLTPLDAS